MKLQIWAEAELAIDEVDSQTMVRLIQDEYPSLSGVAADFFDDLGRVDAERPKVIVSLDGRRVVLAMHPRMICPDCRRDMMRTDVGRFLFVCVCGHREGDTER